MARQPKDNDGEQKKDQDLRSVVIKGNTGVGKIANKPNLETANNSMGFNMIDTRAKVTDYREISI